MKFNIDSAERFADCLAQQKLILISANERLERVSKTLEKGTQQEAAARSRKLIDSLNENITALDYIIRAVHRISSNYSKCEKHIEDRYDSLWYVEKSVLPAFIDISKMGENMKDISFV